MPPSISPANATWWSTTTRTTGASRAKDAGKTVPGVTAAYQGKAPDIGAYEYEGENWKPGHRNRLWVSAQDVTLDARGSARIEVALGTPPLEPVPVKVVPAAGLEVLMFTPEDWMRPKAVSVRSAGSLRLEAPGCPPVHVTVRASGR